MKLRLVMGLLLFLLPLAACGRTPTPIPSPTLFSAPVDTSPPPVTATPVTHSAFPAVTEPDRYQRLAMPLVARAKDDQTTFLQDTVGFQTGPFRLEYTGERFLIYAQDGDIALALTLPGGEALNALADRPTIETRETEAGEEIVMTGRSYWGADFQATLYVYSFHPGLLRWRLEMVRNEKPPAGPELELRFVDRATGEEAKGQLEFYADRAPMAAPHLYAYSGALDSTLFYWVDLTALNPFMEAAHYTPSATPRRMGQRLGHSISRTDLLNQPLQVAVPVYDSYVYLAQGKPDGEVAMFRRYLDQASAVYDLIAVPEDPLPDWADLGRRTLADLEDLDTWVELDGLRYWRAYVGDTRQSAELITQLDVGLAVARHAARYGEGAELAAEIGRGLPNFYNPRFEMVQNSGPLSVTGDQGRGDTWYELGHALKLAEWGLMGNETARQLALDSADAWMDYAHAVDYEFRLFYNFPDPAVLDKAWKGTGREPDCAGGYAYYMLLLHELTQEARYLEEAKVAIEHLRGHGFALAYETHITAQAAAAAARLWQLTGDATYLDLSYGPVANLVRLSWMYEVDYGPAAGARTFFGLMPTQRAAVITPKEQYEAWIYLTEYLQLVHSQIDSSAEKLVAEFCKHTLLTLPYAFPPLLPEGVAMRHPAAYETVSGNRLDLYIPLEDLRDGWSEWGAIGQEVYGAGMAPTLAALAYREVASGVTVYSGYPLVEIEETTVTFAGVPGTYTPVVVIGARSVLDAAGRVIDTEPCAAALCFSAEGGGTYQLLR